MERLALIDMDGTILNGRFITELARHTGREEALAKYLDRYDLTPETRTHRIAALFQGVRRELFEKIALGIPLVKGAVEAVVGLRQRGYRVGVVTDSFHVASTIVRKRVFADFSLANVMEFRHDRATGVVTLAPTMRSDRKGRLAYDKLNALRFLVKRNGHRREACAGHRRRRQRRGHDARRRHVRGVPAQDRPRPPRRQTRRHGATG